MKKTLIIASTFALIATPVFSQDDQADEEPVTPPTAQEIDRAVNAINALINDDQKVDAYCEVTDGEDEVAEGDTAAEDAFLQKLDAFVDGLSEDAQLAFDINETVDEASPEGQTLASAFASLEDQCAADDAEGNEASGG